VALGKSSRDQSALVSMVRFWYLNLQKWQIEVEKRDFTRTVNLGRLPIPPSGLNVYEEIFRNEARFKVSLGSGKELPQ
jgi:hypothetical protein